MTTPDPAPPPDAALQNVPHRLQWRWLGLAAVGLVGIVTVSWIVGHRAPSAREPDAASAAEAFRPSAQQLATLKIEPVVTHRFTTTEVADGRIAVNGDRTTPVFSPYSGRVASVVAGPGDHVAAGATLATIEASEYADARNAFQSALAQATLARATEARKHALFESKGGSQQDWQQAQADLSTADAALAAARDHLRILGQPEAAIDASGRATSGDARIALRAPIAGVVVDREVGPGQYVTAAGATPLYMISDTTSLWIVGTLSESVAPRIHRGEAVRVSVAAWPGRAFSAKLVYVAPTIDPATHRLDVRAVVDNADGALRPEMLATLSIDAGDGSDAPGVPSSAIVYDGDRAHVWVVTADDSISIRRVHIGRATDGLVEVLEGLKAGERVVTRGSLFIDRAARID